MNGDKTVIRDRARARDIADADIPETHKRCSNPACRRVKPKEGGFWKNRTTPDGYQRQCKSCMRAGNATYRATEGYKEKSRAYGRSEARKGAAAERRRNNPKYPEYIKAYRKTPRARLLAARNTARKLARDHKDTRKRKDYAALARLYQGCIDALDPSEGRRVPAGAKRCPGCQVPRPLRINFYVERAAPGGFSVLCRYCNPRTMREGKAARSRDYRSTAEAQVRESLRLALKRLDRPQLPWARAMSEKTVAVCRAELERMNARQKGA